MEGFLVSLVELVELHNFRSIAVASDGLDSSDDRFILMPGCLYKFVINLPLNSYH